jgi:hypothetical protein
MFIRRARHLLLTASALGAAALLFSGCQSQNDERPWAEITVKNSNGWQGTITCQQRDDCPELAAALDGQYRPVFLYPLRRKDQRNGRYREYRLGQKVVPGRPEPLPRLITTRRELFRTGPCLIIRWGPQRLRVRGQVDGKKVNVNIGRNDSCGEEQYLLWNIFTPTDRSLDKNTALAQPPAQFAATR